MFLQQVLDELVCMEILRQRSNLAGKPPWLQHQPAHRGAVRRCDARVLQHGPREVHFRAGEHGEVPGGLVVAPRPAYAVLLRVEDRRRTRGAPVDPVEVVPQGRHPEEDPLVQALDGLFLVRVDVGLGRHRVVGLVRAVRAHVVDGLRLEYVKRVPADVLVVVEEHDGLVPELLLCLVRVEPRDAKCYSSIEDQGPKHRICASCEAKKADRKDAILDKGGKALGGSGAVGAVVVGVIKKLPKKL